MRVPINGASPFSSHDPGVSGGAFGGYTQSNVAARRVVPTEAALWDGFISWKIWMMWKNRKNPMENPRFQIFHGKSYGKMDDIRMITGGSPMETSMWVLNDSVVQDIWWILYGWISWLKFNQLGLLREIYHLGIC